MLVVLDGWSGTRSPEDDRVTLGLELLLADREHVERRLERVAKQAKSGDAGAARGGGRRWSAWRRTSTPSETIGPSSPEPIPAELEPLTTKPCSRS